jgi:hypothetical protein
MQRGASFCCPLDLANNAVDWQLHKFNATATGQATHSQPLNIKAASAVEFCTNEKITSVLLAVLIGNKAIAVKHHSSPPSS